MRFLFLLVFLTGIAAGLAYPWMVSGSEGSEIGSFRVFDAGSGFSPAVVRLSSADAPIGIISEVTAGREIDNSTTAPRLRLSVTSGSRTVLEQTLSFAASTARQVSPQSPVRVYRQEAGMIAADEDGDHTFTAALDGDASGVEAVDIVLRSMHASIDPRVQPVGFALMAVGFVGLVLSLRRGGRPPANPNSQPPPRWGRGGRQP